MIAMNYSQIRTNLNSYLDKVIDDNEIIVITRKDKKNVVLLSEEKYNNILENLYLTSDKANYDWLMESKNQYLESKRKTKR